MSVVRGIRWNLIFSVVIYNLLAGRNSRVFSNGEFKGDMIMRILGMAKDVLKAKVVKGWDQRKKTT